MFQIRGSLFLPERFESEKASPHHNGKLAAGCDHCPHTYRAPALLNMVRVRVTAGGVTTITFSHSPEDRRECEVTTQVTSPQPRQLSALRCVRQQLQRESLRCVLPVRPAAAPPGRVCRGIKQRDLSFNALGARP